MSRKFTLMIIPDSGKQTRRYVISHRLVQTLLVLLGVALGVVGYVGISFYRVEFDQKQFTQLLVENTSQRQSLKTLTRDLDDLQRDLMVLTESDARVREALAPQTFDSASIPVGIGGALDSSPAEMTNLQKKINALRLAIDLRRESQEEVRDLLNDENSLASATPSGWPTKGWITSYFGMRPSPYTGKRKMHEGLDIAANTGTKVIATADGIVVKSTTEPGFGKVVIIDNGYGYRTIYAHNSRLLVKPGTRVKRGDTLSEVGSTGRSTGPHLHYEVHLNGAPVNPRKLL